MRKMPEEKKIRMRSRETWTDAEERREPLIYKKKCEESMTKKKRKMTQGKEGKKSKRWMREIRQEERINPIGLR